MNLRGIINTALLFCAILVSVQLISGEFVQQKIVEETRTYGDRLRDLQYTSMDRKSNLRRFSGPPASLLYHSALPSLTIVN